MCVCHLKLKARLILFLNILFLCAKNENRLDPSNIDKQVEVENLANRKLHYVNRKCKEMGMMSSMDATQQRIYELTCSGLKFQSDNEQRFVI
jgi:hypothetical protein